ncbi:MAG: peptidoglycan-binding protein [Alphaproteobacteria bacterium]|nr:MAG: peptidoglycan-binding protein [Alphaproteobacteria bacterium]
MLGIRTSGAVNREKRLMIYDLEFGDEGTDVRRMQEHLNNVSAAGLSPDGGFGTLTRTALRNYQHGVGASQSGKVDEATFNALASQGLFLLGPPAAGSSSSLSWPPASANPAQPTVARTEAVFSAFEFRHAPTATDPEHIEILDDWAAQNIVRMHIPQLDKGLFAAGRHYVRREQGTISCHRLAAPSFIKLF